MAINIDTYLKEISSDNVCGEDLQYDPDFIELEQIIKGKPEQQIGDTFTEAEPPNWREVKKLAESLLTRTIDLRVLICYLRSLIALDGFSGLLDGITLLTAIVENRWESLHPQLDPDDDNDPTERINVILSICDHDTIIRPLYQLTLLDAKSVGRFNFREISIAQGKSTPTVTEKEVNLATVNAAVQDCATEQLQEVFSSISTTLEQLQQLEGLITDFVGLSDAPNFTELRNLLKEIKLFIQTSLTSKGVVDGDDQLEADLEASDAASGAAPPTKTVFGSIQNNQDVIRTLTLVCDFYRKYEPSSPVPMLVERAIRLVGKSFLEAMQDVAPAGIDEAIVVFGKQHEQDEDD